MVCSSNQMQIRSPMLGEVILNVGISIAYETHDDSRCSVEYLNGARLELCLEC